MIPMGVKQVAAHTSAAIPTVGRWQEKMECLEGTHLEFKKLLACGSVGKEGSGPGGERVDPA